MPEGRSTVFFEDALSGGWFRGEAKKDTIFVVGEAGVT